MKADEEEIQRRIDRHFRWRDALYRLDVMEAEMRRALSDPKLRINVNILKPQTWEYVSPIITPSRRTGLLVGPDGKPL